MTLFNLLVLTIVIFSTSNGSYEADYSITMQPFSAFSRIFNDTKLVCEINGMIDSRRVSFLKGADGIQIAYINNYAGQCVLSTDKPYFYPSCGFGTMDNIRNRTRQFILTIKKITVELMLTEWSCFHPFFRRSNSIWLKPFNMSLSVKIYEPVDSYIPINSHIDLNCVIKPAYKINGSVRFYLHLGVKGVKLIGSASQKGDSCSKLSEMVHCGRGTNSMVSNIKEYKLLIEKMQVDDYNIWSCSQTVFKLESNFLDLRPYKLCDIPCEHGILNKKACKCDCSDYWDGPACDNCKIPCNRGTAIKECKCKCDPGWTGPTCDVEIGCDITKCEHGTLDKDSCSCTCDEYWSGHTCDECVRNCGAGTVDKKCTCTCPSPWSGYNCEKCKIFCINGKPDMQTCTCTCNTYWVGDVCGRCVKPCGKGRLDSDVCICSCNSGWTGPLCEKPEADPERQMGNVSPVLVGLIAVTAIVLIAVPVGLYLHRKKMNAEDLESITGDTKLDSDTTAYGSSAYYYAS